MRVVNLTKNGERRLRPLAGDEVVDAATAARDATSSAYFSGAHAFIRAGEAGRRAPEQLIKQARSETRRGIGDVRMLALILPSTILCSGSNDAEHNAGKANTRIGGKEPEFFVMTADNVVGPGDPTAYDPSYTKKLGAETELAIVIGKEGRHSRATTGLSTCLITQRRTFNRRN